MAEDQDMQRPDDQARPEPPEQRAAPAGQMGPSPEEAGGEALADALRWSFIFLVVLLLGAAAIYLVRSIFTVSPGKVCVKLRFGRPVEVRRGGGRPGKSYLMDAESGWHIQWPWEEVVTIPLKDEQTLVLMTEFAPMGVPMTMEDREALERAGKSPFDTTLSVKTDGYLVTGDLNIVHLRLRVRWRVAGDEGALAYAFRVQGARKGEEPGELLRKLVVRAAIRTVGSMSADEVMSEKKRELLDAIRRDVRDQLNRFEEENDFSAGVMLTGVEYISEPEMPTEVRPHYHAAQTAKDDRDRMLEDAAARKTQIVEQARRQEHTIIENARVYRDNLVATARADEDMMKKLLEDYHKPGIGRILVHWHYLRTVTEFLGKAKTVTIVHYPADARVEIRILLRPPVRARKAEPEEGEEQEEEEKER